MRLRWWMLGLFLAVPALGAQAQYLKTHDASISVGGTGQFSTVFSSNVQNVSTTAPFSPAGTYSVTVTQQNQSTTNSAGFLASRFTLSSLKPWNVANS